MMLLVVTLDPKINHLALLLAAMATLFRRKKPPRTEEEQLFAEYRELEKRTVALSEGIKRWRNSHINLCKGQKRMSTCLKQVNKIGLDASSIARCVDLIITQRYKMVGYLG